MSVWGTNDEKLVGRNVSFSLAEVLAVAVAAADCERRVSKKERGQNSSRDAAKEPRLALATTALQTCRQSIASLRLHCQSTHLFVCVGCEDVFARTLVSVSSSEREEQARDSRTKFYCFTTS